LTGPIGIAGAAGNTGDTGTTGITGATGSFGMSFTGPHGNRGPPPLGITSASQSINAGNETQGTIATLVAADANLVGKSAAITGFRQTSDPPILVNILGCWIDSEGGFVYLTVEWLETGNAAFDVFYIYQ
jgi:hypothetical protein